MDEYRGRLERTEIKICVILILSLFAGVLILPWIGQVIWIAIIFAIYILVTLVIARREELLEKLSPMRESNERSAWYDETRASHRYLGFGKDLGIRRGSELRSQEDRDHAT